MPKRRKQNLQSTSSLYFDVMQEKTQAENVKRKKLSMKANSEPELLFLQFDPNIKNSRTSSSVNKCTPSGSTCRKPWQPPFKVDTQCENTEFNTTYLNKGKLSNERLFPEECKENIPDYTYKKHKLDMSSSTNFKNTTYKDSNHFDSEKLTSSTNTKINDVQDFIKKMKHKQIFDNGNFNIENCKEIPLSIQDDSNKRHDGTTDKCILNPTHQINKNPNINETLTVNQDTLQLFNDDECGKIKQVEDNGHVINEHKVQSYTIQFQDSQTEENFMNGHEEQNTNVKDDLNPNCNQLQHLYSDIQQNIILKSGDYSEIDTITTFNNNIVSGNLNGEGDKVKSIITLKSQAYLHEQIIKITTPELNKDCEEKDSTNYHREQESKSSLREQKDEDIQKNQKVDTRVNEIHFSEMKNCCEHDVIMKAMNTIDNKRHLKEFKGKVLESTSQNRDKKEEGYKSINLHSGREYEAILPNKKEKFEENKCKDDEEKELISTVKKELENIEENQSINEYEEKEYKLNIQDQNVNLLGNKCIENWEEKELVSTVQEQKGQEEGNESINILGEKECIPSTLDQHETLKENEHFNHCEEKELINTAQEQHEKVEENIKNHEEILYSSTTLEKYEILKENNYFNDSEEKELIYTVQEQHEKIEKNINNYEEKLYNPTRLNRYEKCEEIIFIEENKEKEFICHEQEKNDIDKVKESTSDKEEYEYKPNTLNQHEIYEEIECFGNYKTNISTVQIKNKEGESYNDFVMVDSLFENSDSSEEEGEVLNELLNEKSTCLNETDKCSQHSKCKRISYSLEPTELSGEIITSKHSNTCDIYDKNISEEVNNEEGLRQSQSRFTSEIAHIEENGSYLIPCSTIVNNKIDKLEEIVEDNNLQEHGDYDESVEEESSCMMITNSQLCEIEKRYYDNNQENKTVHVQTFTDDKERDLKNESILETNKTISIGTQTDLIFDQLVSCSQHNALLHRPNVHNHKRIQEIQIRIQNTIQEIERLNTILLQQRRESWPWRDFSENSPEFSNTSLLRKK
ncbi:uncharacterized protein PF11_0213-like isoform X2 [Homalodisca vitripennis]|uniref:uncharacterized protein PF11_0213-like isoform X2 n=1 Tax=Homalodisca vitripennis TaxID=197043 RepID=UPI001EEC3FE0|nr:uncharacterized protein PF11_0213-like isoform X2 [Homalodisca vitripennis]XP_046664643.1 uncharacterized protein PF11_0213-like isoform X2 [Homalodisca vitripennis]